jgi:acyl-coenzyme A synthetase/AMP-(fatty) acid ligase
VQVLWKPSEGERAGFEMRRFADRCGFDTYEELQRWSVEDLEGFWQAVWDFYRDKRIDRTAEVPYFDTYPGVWRQGDWVRFSAEGTCIIAGRSDPSAIDAFVQFSEGNRRRK